ncbi:MAG: peptidylprolyl isomerase [Candidatus Zixiibacteriota bacterium]|nr:MAG: peptidylprolyl isomerase [candidate division Zixibacteria bacterium]
MALVKEGDTIKVHYTGKFPDGTSFDSSRDREPLEFTVGAGQLIKGFDGGVRGMEVGEQKTVEVPPDDAYGKKAKSLVTVIKKSEFPDGITPSVGQQLQTEDQGGRPVNLRVTKIEGEEVTLDANHPLAGKTLVFDIEVVEIT